MRQSLVLLLLLVTAAVSGQSVFRGIVVSSENNTPLADVSIAEGRSVLGITNATGQFELSLSNDTATLQFTHIGFQTRSVLLKASDSLIILMNPSEGLLPEAIVKAFEGNTSLKNTAASVMVLDKSDLERYNNASVLPAINTVPGVKMDERSPGSYRLSIRGNLLRSPFGVRNVKVYWNGIPFTDANGNTYLNQLGFSQVGKVEIIKGPGGSLYGAGTGGVVLLNTRMGGRNEQSIAVSALAGSWGLRGTGIAYTNGDANSNMSLNYEHQQSDGWRKQTNMRRDVVNYSGSFKVNDKQTISTNVFYSDLYYQTPGGLTAAQMETDPRQSRPAGGPNRSAEQQQAAIYNKTFYAGFSHEYTFSQHFSNVTSVYGSNTQFRNPSILNYQRKTEQGVGGRSIFQYQQDRVTVHIGGEYQYGFTSTRTFGNQSGVSDTLQFDDEISARQYNLFAQIGIQLPKNFNLTIGASYNNYGYGFTRLNSFPVTKVDKTFNPVIVPRISLLKTIGDNFSVYGTVSRGYAPPTIDEIVPSTGVFNGTLDAEKATNYEIGFRAEPVKNKLFVDVSGYLFKLDNTIVTRRDDAGADFFVNTGKTSQKGIEAAVNYYPVRNTKGFIQELKLWSTYTYINARFKTYKQLTNDFSGNKLTGTPPNVFVFGTDVLTRPGFYLNATYSYTDVLPLNDANTVFATQYNLLFGKIAYKKALSKLIEANVYFAFDHSFNQPYSLGNDLNAAGNRFFNPSAPENYSGGVVVKFRL